MDRLNESPDADSQSCGLIDAPGRKAPCFARLVEEDDVARRIAQASLAPHPRLIARSMLEGDAGTCEPLDLRIEIVALEVDGGRGRHLLVLIGLDRESCAARRLEACVLVL